MVGVGKHSNRVYKCHYQENALVFFFQGFNTEFEELYQIQKTYAVPDTQLRDQLRGENVILILPLYTSFRQK